MSLTTGARLGSYEILSLLGKGGMGEVWRARDTKLRRDVAIKVIAASFARDPERLARFEREAQVLASLNHPHIGGIHGLDEADGTQFLVLELVEGDTLADRIARGPIPLDEAIPIASQIAEALEAAHEQGIIHRDLKPANVKLTPDGVVKVLDFGLAKFADVGRVPRSGPAAAAGQDAADLSMSPTITNAAMMTDVGVLLGTAAYMAPEQAKGRPADKRSDVWAFGCVLYEMLTAKRAFEGEDVSDTLAAVLRGEPDWNALPANIPPALATLLKDCLKRDRRQRIGDIAAARFVLTEYDKLTPTGSLVAPQPLPLPRAPLWRRAIVPAATLTVGGMVAGASVWFATRPAPPRVSRLTVTMPSTAALSMNGIDRDLAMTPDGSRIVYTANNGTQLFVRTLDALEPVAIFKGAPRAPIVSPDGQWVGFVDGTTTLKKVAITGGPAVTVAQLDAASRGATWAPDDTIIFATSNVTTGLQRVPASGGTATVLTRPDRGQGEADHLWPQMLPGGRAVLFTITALSGGLDAAQVAVLDLRTGTRKVLVRGGSDARYVSGYLVYAAAGTLRAVAFDPASLETRGTPVPVAPQVVTNILGGADTSVAADGTFAYVSGGAGGATRTLTWVDRQGRETALPAPNRAYVYPRISPDGSRLALGLLDQDIDIWLWDLARMTFTRATFDPAVDLHHVWTPDGRRLVFSSERAGSRNVFVQAADGTGTVERLTQSPNIQDVSGMVPDGTAIIFTETAPMTGLDVMQLSLDAAHRVTPLVRTSFNERNGVVSPDGRWLTYEANDSGQLEIYVRPYPDVNSGHWQVSTGGGTRPLWARSGQELFYLAPSGALMRVGVERGPTWSSTPPTLLIKEGYFTVPGGNTGRTYDISPDGQRFLMIKEGGSGTDVAPPQIVVIQNWGEELKRLVK